MITLLAAAVMSGCTQRGKAAAEPLTSAGIPDVVVSEPEQPAESAPSVISVAPTAETLQEKMAKQVETTYGDSLALTQKDNLEIDGKDCLVFDVSITTSKEFYTTVGISKEDGAMFELWKLNDKWTPWEVVHSDEVSSGA